MALITELPVELLWQILGYCGGSSQELGSLSRCSRYLHWAAFDHLFNNAFQRRCKTDVPRRVFMGLVLHAIKCDSQHIAQWLCYYELSNELNGLIPSDSDLTKSLTYLHLSIIGDAPRVASYLVKYGTDVWEGGGDYPDITPLYLSIANPRGTTNLDAALRIACSYALPKTCQYLLTRGADPNSLSRFGLAAIHLAVRKRLPWRNFEGLARCINGEDSSVYDWGESLIRTVEVLLRFGADTNLRSNTLRQHLCGPKCWGSPDCEHRGQAVLHYACGGAPEKVVSLLIKNGADSKATDNDGYLPLFSALCQDNNSVALQLLQDDIDPTNLVVVQSHQSTALHIACRFACVEVVSFLLEHGADVNATDVFGRTPLHELLGQSRPELEDRVVEILPHLDDYGAVADIRAQRGPTARQMAKAHPFSTVRRYFNPVDNHGRGSESFQVQRSTWRGSSAEVTRPEIHSCESFPLLSRLPPQAGQDGSRQAHMPGSMWLDKKKTVQLRGPPPPQPARYHRSNKLRESGSRKRATGFGWVAGHGNGGKPSPAVAVRGKEDSRVSESAKFWSTFGSSRQNQIPKNLGQAREDRKENKQDGVPDRGKRGKKWAPLKLY
ncbi:hypothetical protein DHEL01_v203716 [Diaporthe helianthi]|uniref:Uncharacterized protein n=1 Tax=Diaporthe helianthi TaxID=158607 RepID=A0A2P5I5Y6_DIAHE|nr:hypothetical protein DHEL01_v203716 [Diaporthe helianthi]